MQAGSWPELQPRWQVGYTHLPPAGRRSAGFSQLMRVLFKNLC
ncbi:hypothetical protein SynMITS9220_00824 [Synechococcus sp. MIT S9220]|nr:hypothetical protein SynMITS9220_00824 [Synechococcus sp. MIT S9220]